MGQQNTESVSVPITVPTINIEQMITQAVVDSKLGKLIEASIGDLLNNQYSLRSEVEQVVKQEIRGVVSETLSMPFLDDERNPGHGDPNHPARRLRASIVAEVERTLADEDTLKSLVRKVLGGGY